MEVRVEQSAKPVLLDNQSEHYMEVLWSGFSDESGGSKLVSLVVKNVGSRIEGTKKWDPSVSIEITLDSSSAKWLGEFLIEVAEGNATGLRKLPKLD